MLWYFTIVFLSVLPLIEGAGLIPVAPQFFDTLLSLNGTEGYKIRDIFLPLFSKLAGNISTECWKKLYDIINIQMRCPRSASQLHTEEIHYFEILK